MTYEKNKLYMIDKDFANGGIVYLLSFGNYFCTVKDPDTGAIWETMLYRLSEIDSTKSKQLK